MINIHLSREISSNMECNSSHSRSYFSRLAKSVAHYLLLLVQSHYILSLPGSGDNALIVTVCCRYPFGRLDSKPPHCIHIGKDSTLFQRWIKTTSHLSIVFICHDTIFLKVFILIRFICEDFRVSTNFNFLRVKALAARLLESLSMSRCCGVMQCIRDGWVRSVTLDGLVQSKPYHTPVWYRQIDRLISSSLSTTIRGTHW